MSPETDHNTQLSMSTTKRTPSYIQFNQLKLRGSERDSRSLCWRRNEGHAHICFVLCSQVVLCFAYTQHVTQKKNKLAPTKYKLVAQTGLVPF